MASLAKLAPSDAPAPAATRVMIVDDSLVARTVARRALAASPEIEIVASVTDGKAAVDAIAKAKPDVVILDIEMPVMDGLTALPLLLERLPGVKVLIASTLSERNAVVSLKALRAGAADVLLKPTAKEGGETVRQYSDDLLRKVLSLGPASRAPSVRPAAQRPAPRTARVPLARRGEKPSVIAIGSSTGGPQALAVVLKGWADAGVDLPVCVTQHMPPTFTRILAEHIGRASGLPTAEAEDGEPLAPGRILIAPGDRHLTFERSGGQVVARLGDGPRVNFCRPAVDPMLESLVGVFGSGVLACILTGMGRDGREGVRAVGAGGGGVVAQDEATSVVWGMPGAVVEAGLADDVLPLGAIQARLAELAGGGPIA